MIKKIAEISILFVCLSSSSFGQSSFSERVFPGHYDTNDYSGALDASSSFNKTTRVQVFSKEKMLDDSLWYLLSSEMLNLNNFVNEIPNCPNTVIEQNYNYFRYLYRLLSISYLFEGMKNYKRTLYQLGLNHKSCRISHKNLLAKCDAKDPEMKKFIFRSKKHMLKNFNLASVDRLKKKDYSRWFSSLKRRSSSDPSSYWLTQTKATNIDHVEKTLLDQCSSSQKLINMICSEKDYLYGQSSIPFFTDLILKSNTVNVFKDGGNIEYCFKRFVKVYEKRESIYPSLTNSASIIFSSLERKGARYLQGELFLPGSLKEFDDVGMADFLLLPKNKKVATVKKKKKVVIKKINMPKKVVVFVAPVQKVHKKKNIVKKELSEFERASVKLKKMKLKSEIVNIKKMQKDFAFTATQLNALKKPLKEYQTRAALEDMKAYDGLGKKSEPVRLIFLRYLIDGKFHQGLFNMQAVLGKTFYVLNDIDQKTSPVLIELENSSKTNNKWQIKILAQ